jgi:hypothetical protein
VAVFFSRKADNNNILGIYSLKRFTTKKKQKQHPHEGGENKTTTKGNTRPANLRSISRQTPQRTSDVN